MDVIQHDVRTFMLYARQGQSVSTAEHYWKIHQQKVQELREAFEEFRKASFTYKQYVNDNAWRLTGKPADDPAKEILKGKNNPFAQAVLDAQAKLLKAIEDNIWTIAGVGNALDLPMYEGWIATVRSNLSKLSMKCGVVQISDDGKLIPNIEWEPPNMEAIIKQHIQAKADLER